MDVRFCRWLNPARRGVSLVADARDGDTRPVQRRARSAGIIACAALTCVACVAPKRVALKSPFPLTYGGTTIPANGVAVGVEYGDGLAGQERERAGILNLNLRIGVLDRVSVSAAAYGGTEGGDPAGVLWRANVRLGELFGPRSSVAVHAGFATTHRQDLPAQHENLRAIDVAVPAEFLLTDPAERRKGSVYVGPRVTRESYHDELDRLQDLEATYVGVLGGAHLRYGVLHLFAEATLLYVPKSSLHGVTYGGGLTLLPTVGALLRIGTDHKWEGR